MRFFSKFIAEKPVLTAFISFYKNGEINIDVEIYEEQVTELDLIETYCQFYIKTLYNIGQSPVSEMIMQSFEDAAKKITRDQNFHIDLLTVVKRIGKLLKLDFDIQQHLKVSEFRIVTNRTEKPLALHKVEFVKNNGKSRYIKTNMSLRLNKIYIPLALYAFWGYVNRQCLRNKREFKLIFAQCIMGLHRQDCIRSYYKLSSLVSLSNYVEGYFRASCWQRP